MANNKFGMTSWDEVEIRTNKSNVSNKDRYMRLQPGSNVVRIVTKPFQYLVHRYKANPKDPGFGERVLSSLYHGFDPLVEKGMKPKMRWYLGVIDRKTQSYKLLDVSVSVFKSIQELARDEDWGDPSQYDVDIKVDKQGGPSAYYSVIAKPKKPLSPSDLEIKQQVDLEFLKKLCTPPTPEEMQKKIDAIHAKSAAGPVAKEEGKDSESSEEDFDFPQQD